MITLDSKQTNHISFRDQTGGIVYIETGVATFAFHGLTQNAWANDTLSFPVGTTNIPQANFLGGMATGAIASFQANDSVIQAVVPGTGCAVDSAMVTYSTEIGQPIVTFALATFASTFLLRISYTVHLVTTSI